MAQETETLPLIRGTTTSQSALDDAFKEAYEEFMDIFEEEESYPP